jgi:hypothetical protein
MTATANPSAAIFAAHFLQEVRQPETSFISPDRFCTAIGVNRKWLTAIGGVHRNTVQKLESPLLQEQLSAMARVIAAAAKFTGDVNTAIYWFKNEPLADYRYQTPAELVAKGHSDAVLAHLVDLETGALG